MGEEAVEYTMPTKLIKRNALILKDIDYTNCWVRDLYGIVVGLKWNGYCRPIAEHMTFNFH
jgi:GH15 family glucan-1,4-alpha-glucosidase